MSLSNNIGFHAVFCLVVMGAVLSLGLGVVTGPTGNVSIPPRELRFRLESIYPVEPALPTKSFYRVEEELNAWIELQPFGGIASISEVLVGLRKNGTRYLVLAPTAGAWYELIPELFDAITTKIAILFPGVPLRKPNGPYGNGSKKDDSGDSAPSFEDMVQHRHRQTSDTWADTADTPVNAIMRTLENALTLIVKNHVIVGDWNEYRIAQSGSLVALSGVNIRTWNFPDMEYTHHSGSGNRISRRIYKQISNTNGRISVINRVIMPMSLEEIVSHSVSQLSYQYSRTSPAEHDTPGLYSQDVKNRRLQAENQNRPSSHEDLKYRTEKTHTHSSGNKYGGSQTESELPEEKKLEGKSLIMALQMILAPTGYSNGSVFPGQLSQTGAPYIPIALNPFDTVTSFLSMRSDVSLFWALLNAVPQASRKVREVAENRSIHAFVPTDKAVYKLLSAYRLQTRKVAEVLRGVSMADADGETMKEFGRLVADMWSGLDGVPALSDVLLYHFVDSGRSVDELMGAGNVATLSGRYGSFIRVTYRGVEDADRSREPAKPVASYATMQGFVTPIDSVLTPFDLRAAQLVLSAALNSTSGRPRPDGDIEKDVSEVDSPSPAPEDDPTVHGSCFPADGTVTAPSGVRIRMDELKPGTDVVVGADGSTSSVFAFTHFDREHFGQFIKISFVERNETLSLTAGHYLFCNGRLVSAAMVEVGDKLPAAGGHTLTVRSTALVWKRGLYAPHTLHGNIAVGGVIVSTYSMAVNANTAHAMLAPVRLVRTMFGSREPLGSIFYNGAGVAQPFLPSGAWRGHMCL